MNAYRTLPLCHSSLDKGHGFVRDLEQDLNEKEIRSLELQGYIKNAVSECGPTWKLTEQGRQVRDFLLGKRTRKMKVLDWIYKNVLRMNVII
jgi:hypothetical protein